ncbi:MAG: hypothetical protein K8U03_07780 [Planctomycetia bacterium]|nr:hypothetical protein [Planctomycetia bacterium]
MFERLMIAVLGLCLAVAPQGALAEDATTPAGETSTSEVSLKDWGYVSVDELFPALDTRNTGAVALNSADETAEVWLRHYDPAEDTFKFVTLSGQYSRTIKLKANGWARRYEGWVFKMGYTGTGGNLPESIFISCTPYPGTSVYPIAFYTKSKGWHHAFPARRALKVLLSEDPISGAKPVPAAERAPYGKADPAPTGY